MARERDPLRGRPPAEKPLERAPLIRVIAQVRFPVVVGIEAPELVVPFQDSIRSIYPVLRQKQIRRIVLERGVQAEGPPSRVWRFYDLAQAWIASLGPDFLALETTVYSSRQDFIDRFAFLLDALVAHFHPAVVDRIGVRYIDRVPGHHVTDLATFLRPEICGVLATSLRKRTSQALSEAIFSPEEEGTSLRARWGLLPANSTPDPSAIEPLGESSWILDLDMFSQRPAKFDVTALSGATKAYAERIYAFFRWAVTDEFLAAFGGER